MPRFDARAVAPAAFPPPAGSGGDVRLTSAGALRRGRSERLKIWELPGSCHCVTIGTCLTLAELRRLAARLDLFEGAARMTDYELHGAFVHAMDVRNRASQAVQKLLDGKFEGVLRRALRLVGEDALGQMWDEAVAEGMIPGVFWALLTHPDLPPGLEKRVFGEVHMMSHLCGASHRGDARAIALVERQRAAVARRLAGEAEKRREALAERDAEIGRLKRLVAGLEPFVHRSGVLERRLAEVAEAGAQDALRRRAEAAESASRAERARLDLVEEENRLLRARLAEAEQRADMLAEAMLAAGPPPPTGQASPGCAATCPLNLHGRCIAYIGGRPQTVVRIRALVERCNGCLLAHDGGLEQSADLLDGILTQADVVMVPVDCVSHSAMERARLACRSGSAVFAPLASSSFSAFAAALGSLAPTA